MRTNALLDCRADSTFAKEDIAKILQLKKTEAAKDTEWIFRFRSDRIRVSKFLQFRQTITCRKYRSPNHAQYQTCRSHTSYSTQELQKSYQHLQGIDKPSISSSDITVLIGTDMRQLLIHQEYEAGKENEPYAVRAELGWVLIGSKSSKSEKSVTNNVCLVHSIDEINLEQFWNIENYGILSKTIQKY